MVDLHRVIVKSRGTIVHGSYLLGLASFAVVKSIDVHSWLIYIEFHKADHFVFVFVISILIFIYK